MRDPVEAGPPLDHQNTCIDLFDFRARVQLHGEQVRDPVEAGPPLDHHQLLRLRGDEVGDNEAEI